MNELQIDDWAEVIYTKESRFGRIINSDPHYPDILWIDLWGKFPTSYARGYLRKITEADAMIRILEL